MTDAEQSRAPWYIDFIKTQGIPTAFLGGVVFMLWTAGSWAGTNVIYPLFEKQTKFLDTLEDVVKNMDASIEKINDTLDEHGEHAAETMKSSRVAQDAAVANSQKLDILSGKINAANEKIIGVLEKIEQNTGPIRELRPVDMQ